MEVHTKMSKRIRLQDFASNEVVKFLLDTYKEVKKSHNIDDILLFKSFIMRMVKAQYEIKPNGDKQWASLDVYVKRVILENMELDHTNGIDCIKQLAEKGAYNYNSKEHLLTIS